MIEHRIGHFLFIFIFTNENIKLTLIEKCRFFLFSAKSKLKHSFMSRSVTIHVFIIIFFM